MCGRGLKCRTVGHPFHVPITAAQHFVGAILYPVCDIRICRPTFGWIVLKAAVGWRIVRRRHHDTIRETVLSVAVVSQNGSRDRWCRRESLVTLHDGFHPIGRKHLEGASLRRARDCMGVFTYE